MQTQIQMVKPKEEVKIKYKLSSPWNFFLQIDQNFINKGLIYWFGYSMGKIKTVAWGHFDQVNNKMTITGSCKFSTRQLLPIDKIVLDYLGDLNKSELEKYRKIFTGSLNRVDLMGSAVRSINARLIKLGLNSVNGAVYLKYIIDLTKVFLETIEANESLVTRMAETTCANKTECSKEDYAEICEVYFHGSTFYLDPEDQRYDEMYMLA